MTWIDIVIVIVVALLALTGWRIGLIKSLVVALGVIVATTLAGQLSEPVADVLTDRVGSEAIATIVAYVIIGVAAFVGIHLVGNVATGVVNALFLGWANSLGGAAAGAMAGLVAGGAIMAILAHVAFSAPAPALASMSPIDVQQEVKKTLAESSLVPAYLRIYDRLPGGAWGLIPDDFDSTLRDLNRIKHVGLE